MDADEDDNIPLSVCRQSPDVALKEFRERMTEEYIASDYFKYAGKLIAHSVLHAGFGLTGLSRAITELNLSGDQLIELLQAATKNQLFQFNGNLYEQIDGVAMGSRLGPLLAYVFMCSIEYKLDQDGKLPSYYRRYVDDTFTIYSC